MSYDSATLRDGGRTTRRAGDSAQQAESTVRGTPVAAGAFGDVSAAAALAGALGDAQQQHARGARTASSNRDTKAERIDLTADTGDELTVVTAQAATSGVARSVADGMA